MLWNSELWNELLNSISGSAGIAGATVSYSGQASGSVTADGSGNYIISGLAEGTYTITPSLGGYSFTPASQNVTLNGVNISGINFTAASSGGGGGGWMNSQRDFVNKRGIWN